MRACIDSVWAKALASNHLGPLTTRTEQLSRGGLSWRVFVLLGVELKLKALALQKEKKVDPFESPEPELVVDDAMPHHVLLFTSSRCGSTTCCW